MKKELKDGVEVKVYNPKPQSKKMSVAMADWKMKKAKETVAQKQIHKDAQAAKKQEQRIIQKYIEVAQRAVHGIEEVQSVLNKMTNGQRRARLIEIGKQLVEENINK